jgi:transmembrane sensor
MNDQRDKKVNYELLGKFLSGEASPEEAIEVDDWMLQSAENRVLFEQVSASWKGIPFQAPQTAPLSGKSDQTGRTDQGPAIRRIGQPKGSAMQFRKYWIGIAASLLIVSGSVFLFFSSSHHHADRNVQTNGISYSGSHLSDRDSQSPDNISFVTRQAGAEIITDTLPDRSVVVQNVHSRLQYAHNFNSSTREIHMKGEAWFNVTPNPAKPFIIHVGDIRVIVLGTSFNVSEDSSRIEVSVRTGSIMMMSDDADSLVVKAGQKGIYNKLEKKFILSPKFNANDQGYATKILNFENIPLKEIAAQIEKAYGVTVVFQNDSLKNMTMSSSFDNNPITYIFDVISITLHVKYTIENKTVYIRGS